MLLNKVKQVELVLQLVQLAEAEVAVKVQEVAVLEQVVVATGAQEHAQSE